MHCWAPLGAGLGAFWIQRTTHAGCSLGAQPDTQTLCCLKPNNGRCPPPPRDPGDNPLDFDDDKPPLAVRTFSSSPKSDSQSTLWPSAPPDRSPFGEPQELAYPFDPSSAGSACNPGCQTATALSTEQTTGFPQSLGPRPRSPAKAAPHLQKNTVRCARVTPKVWATCVRRGIPTPIPEPSHVVGRGWGAGASAPVRD